MIVSQENFKDRFDDESEDNSVTCDCCKGTGVVTETDDGVEFYSVVCPICQGDGVIEDERDEFSHADDMED
jgi:DnaJ-class molecular chaperone